MDRGRALVVPLEGDQISGLAHQLVIGIADRLEQEGLGLGIVVLPMLLDGEVTEALCQVTSTTRGELVVRPEWVLATESLTKKLQAAYEVVSVDVGAVLAGGSRKDEKARRYDA